MSEVELCESSDQFQVDRMSEATKSARMSNRIPQRIAQRICVWFSYKNNDPPKIAFDKLKVAFEKDVYCYQMVSRWMRNFRNGRNKVGDLFRGEHKTQRTSVKVNVCQDLVNCNRRAGVHYLARHLGVSVGTVFTMLHKDLELKKKSAKQVPHELTNFDRH